MAISDYTPPNSFAMAGCNPAQALGFDWNALYIYTGVLGIFYGFVLFGSASDMMPTTGKMKYLWAHYHAGIKEDADSRGQYDQWTTPAIMFNGIFILFSGLASIWASGNNEDRFTFFHTTTITYWLLFVTCVGNIFKFKAEFKVPMTVGWTLLFLISAILSTIVLIQQDTDAKQLNKDLAEDGLDAGAVLMFNTVFFFISGLYAIGTSFSATEKMGATLYMKEDYEMNPFAVGIQRFQGALCFSSGLITLYGYMLYETDAEDLAKNEIALEFPMAIWIGQIFWFVYGISEFVINENYWEEFAIYQFAAIISTSTAAFIIGWQITCNAEM
jgi:hypothetical protein